MTEKTYPVGFYTATVDGVKDVKVLRRRYSGDNYDWALSQPSAAQGYSCLSERDEDSTIADIEPMVSIPRDQAAALFAWASSYTLIGDRLRAVMAIGEQVGATRSEATEWEIEREETR